MSEIDLDKLGPVPPDEYAAEMSYGLETIFNEIAAWPVFNGIRFDWGEPASGQPTTPPRALFMPGPDGVPEGPSDHIWLPLFRRATAARPLEIPGQTPDGYVRYATRMPDDPPVYVAHIVRGPSSPFRLRYDAETRMLAVELATDAKNYVLTKGRDIADALEKSDDAWPALEAAGGPGIARQGQVLKTQPIAVRRQGCLVQLYEVKQDKLDRLLNLLWSELRHVLGAAFQADGPEPMGQQASQANVGYLWQIYFKVPIFRVVPGLRFLRIRATINPR